MRALAGAKAGGSRWIGPGCEAGRAGDIGHVRGALVAVTVFVGGVMWLLESDAGMHIGSELVLGR